MSFDSWWLYRLLLLWRSWSLKLPWLNQPNSVSRDNLSVCVTVTHSVLTVVIQSSVVCPYKRSVSMEGHWLAKKRSIVRYLQLLWPAIVDECHWKRWKWVCCLNVVNEERFCKDMMRWEPDPKWHPTIMEQLSPGWHVCILGTFTRKQVRSLVSWLWSDHSRTHAHTHTHLHTCAHSQMALSSKVVP